MEGKHTPSTHKAAESEVSYVKTDGQKCTH